MTVYFVTSKGRTDRPVKIGRTADIDRRLSGLQTSHHEELEVIASVEGGPETEAYLHEALADYRIRGEWFARTPEVDATIERLAQFGSTCLPIGEPVGAQQKFDIRTDVQLASSLCREIVSKLFPSEPSKIGIPRSARRLASICQQITARRLNAIFYGEARRIDYFEMCALFELRDQINRQQAAREHLAALPVILSELRKAGTPLSEDQLAAVNGLVQRCIHETGGDAG